MSIEPIRKYCPHCGQDTPHNSSEISFIEGLIHTFISCGIFIPIWIITKLFFRKPIYWCLKCFRRN